MSFNQKVPEWKNPGTEPSESLKKSGFVGGYKPPASIFNWFWHAVSEALQELQEVTPKEIAAVANARQVKTYTALSQIGLYGAVTMEQVCTALPDCSMLVYGNTMKDASGHYITDVPSDYGTIEVVRYNASRIFALFTKASEKDVNIYAGKYHTTDGWSGWVDISHVPTLDELDGQKAHYYYEPSEFGCTAASTVSTIWNAMPEQSVFVYPAPNLTDASWNFPNPLGTVRIEKYAVHRAVIQFFGKSKEICDYRMFLDESTGEPSGIWHMVYTSDNKPSASDISATPWTLIHADTFETFWTAICNTAESVGMVAFRLKDTGGWGPTQTTNMWYNGIVFWQNPPSSTDSTNALILLRVNAPTNEVLYKGAVSGNESSGYTVTWARVYDTNNKPTPEEIGAAPATEAADHPGCYYRMVDGEKEWVNPPMKLDTEYRTTERCGGEVVYAKRIACGATVAGIKTLSNSGRVLYGIPIRYAALVGNSMSPYFYNNEFTNDYSSYVRVELMGIHIYAGAKYTDRNTYVTVWYIQQ